MSEAEQLSAWSPFAADNRKKKLEIKNTPKESEKEAKSTGLFCFWCKQEITDDHYYKCQQHGTLFCDNCAHSFYKKEVKVDEAPYCPNNNWKSRKFVECIWQKITL